MVTMKHLSEAILPGSNHSPKTYFVFRMGVMALMPVNMTAEAHCQEDRGINARKMAGNENVRKMKIS